MYWFQLSKHVEKNLENFKKYKNARKLKNSEKNIFAKNATYVQKHTEGCLCTECERFILSYDVMSAKNEIDLLLSVK